jgi:hypothetical protein
LNLIFTAQTGKWDKRQEPSQHPTSQQELHLPNQSIINNTYSLWLAAVGVKNNEHLMYSATRSVLDRSRLQEQIIVLWPKQLTSMAFS